jgi:hypothetical protein
MQVAQRLSGLGAEVTRSDELSVGVERDLAGDERRRPVTVTA